MLDFIIMEQKSNLFNTLSGIISSQIQLTNIINQNYYNSSIIDDKLSGLTQLDENMDELDTSLQEVSAKLEALSGNTQNNPFNMTQEQITTSYNQVSGLVNAFQF